MDYREIRNAIVKGLYDYLNVPVVPTDDIGDKPDYPYISYKFTTLKIHQGSHNLYKDIVPSKDERFEYDVEYTREEQPKMIISMNAYSTDDVEAFQLALEMESWFKFQGYRFLKDNGIVVVDISNIQDRTIQIVDNYERRQGFDVAIRVMDIQKLRLETIEKSNLKKEE